MFYPIYLDLHGRPCLVVGGGPIATGKVRGLVEAGALVTVVAPAVERGRGRVARVAERRLARSATSWPRISTGSSWCMRRPTTAT